MKAEKAKICGKQKVFRYVLLVVLAFIFVVAQGSWSYAAQPTDNPWDPRNIEAYDLHYDGFIVVEATPLNGPQRRTVTFHLNYGDLIFKQESVDSGSTVNEPSIEPQRNGFDFMGWHIDEGGTILFFEEPIYSDPGLFAGWEAIGSSIYKVIFYWNYDEADNPIFYMTIISGGILSELYPAPQRHGFSFMGWYIDEEGTIPYNFEYSVDSDLDLFARWEAVEMPIYRAYGDQ